VLTRPGELSDERGKGRGVVLRWWGWERQSCAWRVREQSRAEEPSQEEGGSSGGASVVRDCGGIVSRRGNQLTVMSEKILLLCWISWNCPKRTVIITQGRSLRGREYGREWRIDP
jgi:hypothetical protein